jgi:hypothetical protein
VIRINLLKHLPPSEERLQSMLNPARSGGFISRRETILGGLFLALAAGILGSQLWLSRVAEEEDFEAASSAPPVVSSAPAPPAPAIPVPAAPAEQPAPRPEPPEIVATAEVAPASPTGKAAEGRESEPGRLRLSEVRVTSVGDGLDIFLAVTGSPKIRSFRVDNPSRVVFDIPGAILEAPSDQRIQRLDGALVSRLRIAQNELEPPLVRLVLEVPEFPAAAGSVSEAGVSIQVRRP